MYRHMNMATTQVAEAEKKRNLHKHMTGNKGAEGEDGHRMSTKKKEQSGHGAVVCTGMEEKAEKVKWMKSKGY